MALCLIGDSLSEYGDIVAQNTDEVIDSLLKVMALNEISIEAKYKAIIVLGDVFL